MEHPAHGDTDVDDEFDDPLLRALAAAPSIPFGEPTLPTDTVVGQSYTLHRVIGAGAMGVVYEATDAVLSRRVAIKVHEIGRSDRAARMWREARAMARLAHPNVVTVHEVGVDGSRGYIAMELVEGTNARKWCTATTRTWVEIVDVYRQAGEGLAAAHDVGIVHRDFKPDNVLIGDDGRVRVADFGLALEPDAASEHTATSVRSELAITRTGTTLGTPAYMAPEQAERGLVDARADQYAFCVALYEALHGTRPTLDGTKIAVGSRALLPDGVPAWIDAVIERGLAKDPGARHPDMRSLVRALDPAPRRRRRAAIAILVGAVVGGVMLLRLGGALATDAEPCTDAGVAIDGTWSDARGDELRSAFASAGEALAGATEAVLVPAFDDFVARWRDEARDACEATRVRGEQSEARLDQRMDCLARARLRFAAAIDVMREGDPAAMARADAVAASLPDPAACSHPDAVLDVAPLDDERRAEFDALAGELDRIVAQYSAGRVDDARAALDDLVPRIDAAGFTRMLGDAKAQRGVVMLDLGRRADAIEDLAAATSIAVRWGDRDAMGIAMLGLAAATGRTPVGTEEAKRWLANARALADELQWSASRRDELVEAELEILFYAEEFGEVERVAREGVPEIGDLGVHVRALSLLATALERQSRFEESLAVHDEALAIVERERGPEHPQTAMVLANRVRTLETLARRDEARASLDRVLAIRLAAFGPDAPVVGEAYRQLGDAEADGGNVDAAVRHYERAIAIGRRAGDDAGIVLALGNFSNLRMTVGDAPEAARLLDEALLLAEHAFGPNSYRVAQLLINRSGPRLRAGEYAVAASELERALGILTREIPAESVLFAYVRTALARAYAELGRVDEAMVQYEEARHILDATLAPDSYERVSSTMSFAELLERLGKSEDSLAKRREAAELADRILPAAHRDRISIWRQLGRQLVDLGKFDEAVDVLGHAQELDPGDDPEHTAELAELLARAKAKR